MNYAAVRHLAPGVNAAGALKGMDTLPWETDLEQGAARQETWLLSFIDILALLLTLFVLLLAFQDRGQVAPAPEVANTAPVAPEIFNLLAFSRDQAGLSQAPTDGYAMPGEGLVPLEIGPVVSADGQRQTVGGMQPPQAEAGPPDDRRTRDPAAAALADQPDPAGADAQAQASGDTQPSAAAAPAVADSAAAAEPASIAAAPPVAVDAAAQLPASPVSAAQGMPAPATRHAADRLLDSLRDSALGDRVEVITHPGAVNLEISDSILFAPASAALSAEGGALLTQLAAILKTLPYSVSVEGHTDNVPIHTALYPSNWELSSARAAGVTRKLIEQGVAGDRLRTVGYGDTRPRGDNATAQARAKNRRVTFVLRVEDSR